ncbi:MAG: hypothetical protein JO069_18825 [Verrucomicrobia bacterium]|nr:hypothetical protein [Verrucomicrobiota bacterium]
MTAEDAEDAAKAPATNPDRRWRVRITAEEPFTYRLMGWELRFDSAQATIHYRPGQPIDVHFDGRAGGGTWVSDFAIAPDAALRRWTVRLSDFPLGGPDSHRAAASGTPSGCWSGDVEATAGADGDVRFQANLSLRDASLDSAPPFLRAFRAHLKALGFDNAIDLGLEAQGDLASFQVSRLQAASGSHRLDLSGSVQTLGMLLDLTGTCDKQVEVQIAGSLVDPDWKVAPPRQPAAPK